MAIRSLYKYGRLNEYSEEVFSTPTIWLSPPAQLNDPFECRPWLTFDDGREESVQSLVKRILERHPDLDPDQALTRATSIVGETRDEFRDRVIATLESRLGLYCLSENNDSILMWSHYAAEHRGYCLEFEATDDTTLFGAARKVQYSTDLPVIDFFGTSISREERIDRAFFTKFVGWSYEQEWRIVDHEGGPGAREYSPDTLRSVIFGFRMPEADRARITTWIKKRGHTVRFLETRRHDRQFKVVVDEIR